MDDSSATATATATALLSAAASTVAQVLINITDTTTTTTTSTSGSSSSISMLDDSTTTTTFGGGVSDGGSTPSSGSGGSGAGGGGGDALVKNLDFAIGAVFTPIFCILGMVGNGLAAVIWNRPALRSSTGRFLSAQAVADFGVLFLSLIVVSSLQWTPGLKQDTSFAVFFSYVGVPLYYICVHCSVWLTLGVTIDRYILVCWITKAKSYCQERQANMGIALIIICSIVANIPHFMFYKAVTPEEDGGPSLVKTDFAKETGGKVYALWISCISLIVIPWCCVLFMNVAIIKQIRESNRRMNEKKNRDSVRKSKKVEEQITRLLLVVTFSFLFFMGLHCLIQIMAITQPHAGFNSLSLDSAYSIAKTGYALNSSLNFVLYCLTGKRFRRELKKVLGIELTKDDMTTLTHSQSQNTSSVSATASSATSTSCN